MIDASRFLVCSSDPRWHELRRQGVSATTVAHAATESGFRQVLEERANPIPFDGNAYTDFGNEQEPFILEHAHREYGILPSDWLIAGENRSHMATPDGLALDHTVIAEVKTTGDPWDGAEGNQKKIPIQYRRQVQWQLHVTNAERCLFLWMLRATDDFGDFYPAWFEPRTTWIDRDEDMIGHLVRVADRLLEAESGELQRTA